MGRIKQLLPLGDKPVIRHSLDTLRISGIDDVVTVLGFGGEEIIKIIGGFGTRIMFNADTESDMAESVRIGLRAANPASSGVLICLSDHPLVSATTIKSLVEAHCDSPDKIVIPIYERKRGHPSLFPTRVIREIYSGLNLREIIDMYNERVRLLHVSDEGVILDMDTVEDYKMISEKAGC